MGIRMLRLGCHASLAALVAALAIRQIRSVDYGWHLAAGDWIWRHGSVPKTDPFSYSVAGAPWLDVHWLFQLGLRGLYGLGGHDAVILGKLAFLALTTALVVRTIGRPGRPGLVAFATALGLCALSERVLARPEIASFALLAGELALLERFRRRPDAWVFAIVGLQLVWANVHGLFAVGLAVIAMAFVGEGLDALRRGELRAERRRLALLAAAGLLSGLASLLTPNGWAGVAYPLKQLLMVGSSEMRASVGLHSAELRSLVYHWREVDPVVLVGFVGLAGGGAAALLANARRVRAFDVLLLIAFVLLALMAVRNVALLGVVGPPVLARNLADALERRSLPAPWARVATAGVARMATIGVAAAVLAFAGVTASGRLALALRTEHAPGFGVLDHRFPEGAADWIARERPPGPLHHHMGDGGYLIWRLHPDYPVLADGRLEVYGAEAAALFDASPRGFDRLDARFGFGTVLLGYNHHPVDALLAKLLADPRWRLAFVDEVAAVFVARRPDEPWASDLDVRSPTLFPERAEERSLADLFARRGRARFRHAAGQPREAAREIHELALRYPAWVGR